MSSTRQRLLGRSREENVILALCIVGGLGIIVHLLVLAFLFKRFEMGFVESQTIATGIAMTFNFSLNNVLTYREMRLKGWRWFRGWLSFTLGCAVGAFANIGMASYLFSRDTFWLLSSLAGIIVGAVWNYTVTATFTWGKLNAR